MYALEEAWTSPFTFHPNAVVADRDVALAAGGWPALRASDDLGFAFALNRVSAGAALPHTVLRYRVWASQLTQSPGYPDAKEDDFGMIEAVINASRARRGRPPIAAPDPVSSYRGQRRPDYWQTAVTGTAVADDGAYRPTEQRG